MKFIFLMIVGVSAGLVTSAGVFALITVIGIIPRLAGRSRTASYIRLYEWMIILGGVLGTLEFFAERPLKVGNIELLVFGLGSGIFVSCLTMSLAETLDVFPIMVRRLRLKVGFPWITLAFALGKSIGALLFFWKGWSI